MKKLFAFIAAITVIFAAFGCTTTTTNVIPPHEHTPELELVVMDDGIYNVTSCSSCGETINSVMRFDKITDGIFRDKTGNRDFTITSADGLLNFAAIVNGTSESGVPTSTFLGKTITLFCDIDMTGKPWTSITGSQHVQSVTFDGKGHKIIGFNVAGHTSVGFIATATGNITFKNLIFENAAVDVAGKWGAVLVGVQESGTFTAENVSFVGCTLHGSISAMSIRIGTCIGHCRLDLGANARISGCTVDGCTFTGYHTTCGLVGTLLDYGSHDGTWTISGCSVKNCTFNIGSGTAKYVSPYTVDGGSYPARETNDEYFTSLGNTEENNTFTYSFAEE